MVDEANTKLMRDYVLETIMDKASGCQMIMDKASGCQMIMDKASGCINMHWR
jgi:precorrin-6x reductase